ncbi:hypothetical protein H8F22_10995 [Pseudomonas sp. P154a]|uniref:hypothetical protein n=1 Tax=Pseudomonas mucoides TaxID=2730424 RepID=UPI001891F73E|nr:hypothetical protein [Pseudomonas mucoides]MBF6039398.1 hypothetical protein [Pseudomonas mucoides]
MLTIDPKALAALAIQLAKVDAAQQAVLDAMDALETAASTANESTRMACVQALRAGNTEYDGALIDLVEQVRVTLYGEDEE